jgi:hypothetical protein
MSDRKIKYYTILEFTSPHRLADSVQVYIKDGWVPFGGVAVRQEGHLTEFYQAMVKYEQSEHIQKVE